VEGAVGQRDADARTAGHSVGRLFGASLTASVLDRTLALVLLAVIAGAYGASSDSDTYFLALVVPLAIGGALTEGVYAALLPHFTSRASHAPITGAVWFSALAALALLVVYVGAVLLAWPDQIGVWLLLAAVVPAMAIAGACSAALVARKRYAVAAARVPIGTALTLAVVCAALPFTRSLLVFGAAMPIGYFGALLFLLVFARRKADARSAQVTALNPVALAGASASVFLATLVGGPLVVVVERAMAAGLPTGSVALLTFARNLALLSLVITTSLASGMFPVATIRRSASDHDALCRLLVSTFRLGMLVCLSVCAFTVICRNEIIDVALRHGELTSADAAAVAQLLVLFAGAVIGLTLAAVAVRGFYALGRYRLVAQVSALSLALYVVAAFLLRAWLGRDGLALAFLVSSLAAGGAAAVLLARTLDIPLKGTAMEVVVRPAAIASVFAAAVYAGLHAAPFDASSDLASLGRVACAAVLGLIVLSALIALLRNDEYRLVKRALGRG
jgi:putative peptidoglycan lipid II flippase